MMRLRRQTRNWNTIVFLKRTIEIAHAYTTTVVFELANKEQQTTNICEEAINNSHIQGVSVCVCVCVCEFVNTTSTTFKYMYICKHVWWVFKHSINKQIMSCCLWQSLQPAVADRPPTAIYKKNVLSQLISLELNAVVNLQWLVALKKIEEFNMLNVRKCNTHHVNDAPL